MIRVDFALLRRGCRWFEDAVAVAAAEAGDTYNSAMPLMADHKIYS